MQVDRVSYLHRAADFTNRRARVKEMIAEIEFSLLRFNT
jgi:hypothetical protein